MPKKITILMKKIKVLDNVFEKMKKVKKFSLGEV